MSDTKAPTITITPAKPQLAAGRESTTDFLIRIEAPAQEAEAERRPLNLGIVLDRSGSMQGQKLARAKEAVAFAVRNMAPEDRISLTIYDSRVETLVASGPVATVGPQILSVLPSIHARSTTALHDAWVKGGFEVSQHLDPRRLNRVLLISDGLANVGMTDPDTIVSHAGELFSRGVSTSTIGVGHNFNEDLMIPMAVSAGGNGWFVESPDDFRRIFEAELAGLAALFGEKGTLRIEPRRPGTKVVDLLNDFPSGEAGWEIGSLHHGQPLEIVARVKARGGEPGQPLDLFDVRLSWEVPDLGRIELQQLARVGCDEPARVEALPVDPDVDRVVALLMAARARVEAIGHIDAGDYTMAYGLAHSWAERMSSRSDAYGEVDAKLDAREFEQLRDLLDNKDNPEAARRAARKLARYQAYHRMSGSRRQT